MNIVSRSPKTWPYAQSSAQDSVGKLLGTLHPGLLGDILCWEAKGEARRLFESSLKKSILDYLLEHSDKAQESGSYLSIPLFMVGKRAKRAKPVVMLVSDDKVARKEAYDLILHSDIMTKYPGFELGHSDFEKLMAWAGDTVSVFSLQQEGASDCYRLISGQEVSDKVSGRKILASAGLGALGTESITRARNAYGDRSRGDDTSPNRDSAPKQGLGLAAAALAVAGAAKYLRAGKVEKKERHRGRSRSRGYNSSDDEHSPSRSRSRSRRRQRSTSTSAKAAVGTAAVAGLVQHFRNKSRTRSQSRSKSRLRNGSRSESTLKGSFSTAAKPGSIRTATAGGVVSYMNKHMLLSVSHFLKDSPSIELPAHTFEASQISDCEITGLSDFDDDDDDETDTNFVETVRQGSVSDVDESKDSEMDDAYTPTSASESDRNSQRRLSISPQEPSSPEGRLIGKGNPVVCSEELDYALFEVDMNSPSAPLLNNAISLTDLDKIESGPRNTAVKTVASNGRVVHGLMSEDTLPVRLPHSKEFTEVYTARFFGPLGPGDCGGWVRDKVTGRLFGHVFAGNLSNGLTAIMPAKLVFEHARALLDQQFALTVPTQPSHELQKLEGSALQSIDEDDDSTHAVERKHWTDLDTESTEMSTRPSSVLSDPLVEERRTNRELKGMPFDDALETLDSMLTKRRKSFHEWREAILKRRDALGSPYSSTAYGMSRSSLNDDNSPMNSVSPSQQLPCEFYWYGDCKETFDLHDIDRWVDHVAAHHLEMILPSKSSCWFCDEVVFHAQPETPKQCRLRFTDRMHHIAGHYRRGATLADVRPDFDFIDHLRTYELISEGSFQRARHFHETPQPKNGINSIPTVSKVDREAVIEEKSRPPRRPRAPAYETVGHAKLTKKYVCRDPTVAGLYSDVKPDFPLSQCPECSSGKKYNAYYMAADHLRRKHFQRHYQETLVNSNSRVVRLSSAVSDLRLWTEEVLVKADEPHGSSTAVVAQDEALHSTENVSPSRGVTKNVSPSYDVNKNVSPSYYANENVSPSHSINENVSPSRDVNKNVSPSYDVNKNGSPSYDANENVSPSHSVNENVSPSHDVDSSVQSFQPLIDADFPYPSFDRVEPFAPLYPSWNTPLPGLSFSPHSVSTATPSSMANSPYQLYNVNSYGPRSQFQVVGEELNEVPGLTSDSQGHELYQPSYSFDPLAPTLKPREGPPSAAYAPKISAGDAYTLYGTYFSPLTSSVLTTSELLSAPAAAIQTDEGGSSAAPVHKPRQAVAGRSSGRLSGRLSSDQRRKSFKFLCTICNDHPGGFRGPHELDRHMRRHDSNKMRESNNALTESMTSSMQLDRSSIVSSRQLDGTIYTEAEPSAMDCDDDNEDTEMGSAIPETSDSAPTNAGGSDVQEVVCSNCSAQSGLIWPTNPKEKPLCVDCRNLPTSQDSAQPLHAETNFLSSTSAAARQQQYLEHLQQPPQQPPRSTKRPRRVSACTECQKRKTRCDSHYPCLPCQRSNRLCKRADQDSFHQSVGSFAGAVQPLVPQASSDAEGSESHMAPWVQDNISKPFASVANAFKNSLLSRQPERELAWNRGRPVTKAGRSQTTNTADTSAAIDTGSVSNDANVGAHDGLSRLHVGLASPNDVDSDDVRHSNMDDWPLK